MRVLEPESFDLRQTSNHSLNARAKPILCAGRVLGLTLRSPIFDIPANDCLFLVPSLFSQKRKGAIEGIRQALVSLHHPENKLAMVLDIVTVRPHVSNFSTRNGRKMLPVFQGSDVRLFFLRRGLRIISHPVWRLLLTKGPHLQLSGSSAEISLISTGSTSIGDLRVALRPQVRVMLFDNQPTLEWSRGQRRG
jgi:hypothetical protein